MSSESPLPPSSTGLMGVDAAEPADKAFDLSTLSIAEISSARVRLEELWLEWITGDGSKVVDTILDEACARIAPGRDGQLKDSVSKRESPPQSPLSSPPSSPLQPPRSPTRKSPKKRTQAEISPPLHNGAPVEQRAKAPSPHNALHSTFQQVCAPRSIAMHIPPFYNPEQGKCLHRRVPTDTLQNKLAEIENYFKPYPRGIPVAEFTGPTKSLCGFPRFFNIQVCQRIADMYDVEQRGITSPDDLKVHLRPFLQFWKNEMEPFDPVERFFRVIKKPEAHEITKDDFHPVLIQLLNTHPGLEFLRSHEDFQRKYALTVITRIFYTANTSRSGRLSLRELRRSNVIQEFHHVDDEEDINKVTNFFSYEHFYVLYCRFFELDTDNDARLSREDLMKYGEHALSEVIVDRVFKLGERVFSDGQSGDYDKTGMSYPDFIFFMLSEEDKGNPVALRYWFRCVDLDGDGVITPSEMSYFYRTQLHRITSLGQESVQFEDMMCQMLDMIDAEDPLAITLKDLTRPDRIACTGVLFDALFNLHKFIRFELRDPFAEKQKRDDPFEKDWDRFAYFEYHRLAAEEEGDATEVEDSPHDMSMEVELMGKCVTDQSEFEGFRTVGHDDKEVDWLDDGPDRPGQSNTRY